MKRQMNIKKAAVFSIIGAISMSIMALFVKLAAPHTTNSMTIFFRFGVSLIYVFLIVGIRRVRGHSFPMKTKNLKLQIFRSIFGLLAMLLFYYSLKYIPLIDGNLLVMTNALFVPILAVIFLREHTDLKSWIFVIIGFIGVILVLKPGHELFNPASFIALGGGLCAAFSYLSLREATKYDGLYTNMIYYFTIAFLISGLISVLHWQTPDKHTIMLLLAVGFFATIYQESLIRAFTHAPARIVTSLMYISVIMSGIFGWLVWGHIPDLLSWLGIALVCAGSILTVIYSNA